MIKISSNKRIRGVVCVRIMSNQMTDCKYYPYKDEFPMSTTLAPVLFIIDLVQY